MAQLTFLQRLVIFFALWLGLTLFFLFWVQPIIAIALSFVIALIISTGTGPIMF